MYCLILQLHTANPTHYYLRHSGQVLRRPSVRLNACTYLNTLSLSERYTACRSAAPEMNTSPIGVNSLNAKDVDRTGTYYLSKHIHRHGLWPESRPRGEARSTLCSGVTRAPPVPDAERLPNTAQTPPVLALFLLC